MTNQTIYLTHKGMKELKKELAKLDRELSSIRETLRGLDKADDHEARLARVEWLSKFEATESEIASKKALHDQAVELPRKRDALRVALGSVVDLIDQKGRMVRYQIVDSIEANPSDGRISALSPLGRELLGRQIHDMVEWSAGLRSSKFQLVSIA